MGNLFRLSRFLSFIISFQLLWGCNGQFLLSGALSDELEISGVIARVLQNTFISSAHASDERGRLIVTDISDLDKGEVIYSEEIVGKTYSFKVNRNKSSMLKIEYIPDDENEESREAILDPSSEYSNRVDLSLNRPNSIQSKIIRQIVLSGENVLSNKDELSELIKANKNIYTSILQKINSDFFEHSDKIVNLLFNSTKETSDEVASTLYQYYICSLKKDVCGSKRKFELISYLYESGALADEELFDSYSSFVLDYYPFEENIELSLDKISDIKITKDTGSEELSKNLDDAFHELVGQLDQELKKVDHSKVLYVIYQWFGYQEIKKNIELKMAEASSDLSEIKIINFDNFVPKFENLSGFNDKKEAVNALSETYSENYLLVTDYLEQSSLSEDEKNIIAEQEIGALKDWYLKFLDRINDYFATGDEDEKDKEDDKGEPLPGDTAKS
jgi:hypothetical protein